MSPAAARRDRPSPPGHFLFDAFVAFLREDGWPVDREDEKEQALAVPVEGNSGRWVCAGQILDDRPLLLFSSILPAYVTPGRREAVADFLHRANEGLLFGGFQYSLDEGEVRYVNSLDLSGVDPDQAVSSGLLPGLLRRMVYANIATTDQYYSALMSVIHAGVAPAAAIAEAEG